jgi:hypothetical protein
MGWQLRAPQGESNYPGLKAMYPYELELLTHGEALGIILHGQSATRLTKTKKAT